MDLELVFKIVVCLFQLSVCAWCWELKSRLRVQEKLIARYFASESQRVYTAAKKKGKLEIVDE